MIPTYAQLITEEWFNSVMSDGRWDPQHGSDVGRLVEDIQADTPGLPRCPASVAGMEPVKAAEHLDMLQAIKKWLRARFKNVIAELPKGNLIKVCRVMRVDQAWLDGLAEGTATSGIYYGEFPMWEDGGYWIDEDKPHHVYMEATIDAGNVDWSGTILARMDYETGDQELEIRAKENVHIVINRLQIDDEEWEAFTNRVMTTGEKRPHVIPNKLTPA